MPPPVLASTVAPVSRTGVRAPSFASAEPSSPLSSRRAAKAGLQFPVGRIDRHLRKGRYAARIGAGAPGACSVRPELAFASLRVLTSSPLLPDLQSTSPPSSSTSPPRSSSSPVTPPATTRSRVSSRATCSSRSATTRSSTGSCPWVSRRRPHSYFSPSTQELTVLHGDTPRQSPSRKASRLRPVSVTGCRRGELTAACVSRGRFAQHPR